MSINNDVRLGHKKNRLKEITLAGLIKQNIAIINDTNYT